MAEMEMRVDHLTRLYELKDKDVQELIKHFGSVLKTIVKSLNVSVSEDITALIAAYNKSIEMVKSPMGHFDVYTFLPHLRSHKDYLKPLILHSRSRNAGYLLILLHPKDKMYGIQTNNIELEQ